jgi:hypothetical protein
MSDSIRVTVIRQADRSFLVLKYVDPDSGRRFYKSAKTTDRAKAGAAAEKWRQQIEANNGYIVSKAMGWDEFVELYTCEHLKQKSKRTMEAALTAFNHLARVIDPRVLTKISLRTLDRFVSELRKAGMKETTIACHLRSINAALGWASSRVGEA